MSVTTTIDFEQAFDAINMLLAKYASQKGDADGHPKWRDQSVIDHIEHAVDHARLFVEWYMRGRDGVEEDLVSAACRTLMALQLALERRR